MKRFIIAATAILVTSSAWAEEGGEALLTVADVEQAFALATSSDFSGSPDFPSVNLSLSGPRDGNATDVVSVMLGFEIHGDEAPSPEARLLRRVGEETEWLFCYSEAEPGGLTVALEEFAIDGDLMSVHGQFSCNFGTSENYGRDIDLSDPLAVSGQFNVTLERL